MEKSEMFLKILSFALLFSGCLSESRYEYETVNGHDLSSAVPLEISFLRDDGVDSASRHIRSLSSTEASFAYEGPDSGSNSAPPHILGSPAGGPSSTHALLEALSSSPTMVDKVHVPSGVPPAVGSGPGKTKPLKKVPASGGDEKSKTVLLGSGVSGSINTPVSNGHSTGGSNNAPSGPPLTVVTNNHNAPATNNTAYVTSPQSNPSPAAPTSGSAASTSSHPAAVSSAASSSEDFDDLPNMEEEISNKTLASHHILSTTNDTHSYYNSSVSRDEARARGLWVELTDANSKRQDTLSNAHRRAVTQKLSFDFPFYGHLVHNVTITTGGFLYTGEQTHPWLAATQFIAPLMANFDTSLTHDSVIRYLDNETQLTVQWENVRLQDKPDAGGFTFQATLYKSGNIAFVYKTIPVVAIDDDHHPVKVGLSDSYVMDKTIFFVRRKTIYEYHRVQFSHTDISNWTSIYLTALPTCLDHKDCEGCLTDMASQFACSWCPMANRCSTGLDRNRQDWVQKGCDRSQITNAQYCAGAANYAHHIGADSGLVKVATEPKVEAHKMGISSLFFTLISLACIVGMVVWAVYAYNNPMSSSGQILIRYRPSQWTMKRGEARYTAATIHM